METDAIVPIDTNLKFVRGTHTAGAVADGNIYVANTVFYVRDDPDAVANIDYINQDYRESYEYTGWGVWNQDGLSNISNSHSGNLSAGSRLWAAGDATQSETRPRSGSATFSGEIAGFGSTGQLLVGDIGIVANFGNDTVTTNMNINRENGDSWATATGVGTIQDTSRGNFGTSVIFTSSGHANSDENSTHFIQGTFHGPNAEEVSGRWGVDNLSGSDFSSAHGIFRAQN